MDWNKYFNKPDKPIVTEWQKMFKPVETGDKSGIFGLDPKTCSVAEKFYGANHPLVKKMCKPKFKIVWT